SYELIALFASGISPYRILLSVLSAGLLFGGLHIAVNEWALPHTSQRLERAYTEASLEEVPDRNFLFVETDHADQLAKFFMIGQIQKDVLSDFIILYYEDTNSREGVQITRILRSRTGSWVPRKQQWRLVDGIEYVLNEEGVYK